jgi:serine/threonine protein kinase
MSIARSRLFSRVRRFYLRVRACAQPENILLKEKGRDVIKISDFGLSRVVGEGSFIKTLCGTPQVCAPGPALPRFVLSDACCTVPGTRSSL